MPIELTGAYPPEHRLQPGDVIMVKRQLLDKKTKKPFDWRFFALVLAVARSTYAKVIILDGREDREPQAIRLQQLDETFQIWFLPEAEWPDGIHVFRTKLILEGKVEGVDALF